jgi:hypothetical protein
MTGRDDWRVRGKHTPARPDHYESAVHGQLADELSVLLTRMRGQVTGVDRQEQARRRAGQIACEPNGHSCPLRPSSPPHRSELREQIEPPQVRPTFQDRRHRSPANVHANGGPSARVLEELPSERSLRDRPVVWIIDAGHQWIVPGALAEPHVILRLDHRAQQKREDAGVSTRGSLLDRATQQWVRATGRHLDLGTHRWLDGPTGGANLIGDDWLLPEAARHLASLEDGGGLLSTMNVLDGDHFDPSNLSPQITDFYEHTSDWHLDVWSQWCPIAWPFGWLLSSIFAQRLEQLSLPLRPLDAAHGMDSKVVVAKTSDGTQVGAMWLRTLRHTGQTVYSGWYGTALLPGHTQPSIRIAFPLPNGSITVFLRPSANSDGSLRLTSAPGRFGDDGAYLIVNNNPNSTTVKRVPIHEEFHVYVDDNGVLRADHALDLGPVPVIRFHYRLTRTTPG